MTTERSTRPPVMTLGLTLLFAASGGAAVGNLYWAQPLLDLIARDLHASAAAAGWRVTATQIGYAAGILLIVPLGDVRDRRRLVPAMMLAAVGRAPGWIVDQPGFSVAAPIRSGEAREVAPGVE